MFRVSQHPSLGVLKLYQQPPVQVIISVQLLPSNVAQSGLGCASRVVSIDAVCVYIYIYIYI